MPAEYTASAPTAGTGRRRRSTSSAPRERTLRIVSGALALAGIGVATYIAIAEAGGSAPVCLAGGKGCATVAASEYSEIAGINVAVFGIAGYVALLAAALGRGDLVRFAGFLVALTGAGFSAYLTYLELFVIDAICQWCVASAVLMTLLLVVNAAWAFLYAGAELLDAEPADTGSDEEDTTSDG